MKEHKRGIQQSKTLQSAVVEHVHKTGHYFNWKDVKCENRDQHWYFRRVKETIQIQLHPDNLNRDTVIEISKAWLPIVQKHQSGNRPNQCAAPTSKEALPEGLTRARVY